MVLDSSNRTFLHLFELISGFGEVETADVEYLLLLELVLALGLYFLECVDDVLPLQDRVDTDGLQVGFEPGHAQPGVQLAHVRVFPLVVGLRDCDGAVQELDAWLLHVLVEDHFVQGARVVVVDGVHHLVAERVVLRLGEGQAGPLVG